MNQGLLSPVQDLGQRSKRFRASLDLRYLLGPHKALQLKKTRAIGELGEAVSKCVTRMG